MHHSPSTVSLTEDWRRQGWISAAISAGRLKHHLSLFSANNRRRKLFKSRNKGEINPISGNKTSVSRQKEDWGPLYQDIRLNHTVMKPCRWAGITGGLQAIQLIIDKYWRIIRKTVSRQILSTSRNVTLHL